ncbi:MAG: hypothetical protein K9H25_01760 [Rhodospirillum sp.]|nr:hypothetical protein [Rhodospirillum sp.]MCF8487853.1 hypothetical protein [Rhodospirillum sp.]MCF8499175.1 hypothetical protein [Rhodospirillum sp.]
MKRLIPISVLAGALLASLLVVPAGAQPSPSPGVPQGATGTQGQPMPLGDPPASGQGPSLETAPKGEALVVPRLQGWTLIYKVSSDTVQFDYFVPDGQSAENWEDMITIKTTRGPQAPGLKPVHERTVNAFKAQCQTYTATTPQTRIDNNIGRAFWILGCNRRRDMDAGETVFNLFIQGRQAVYLIQRTWRLPAFGDEGPSIPPEEQQAAMALLPLFTLCDPTAGDGSCVPAASIP